ncbi:hypothetical protein BO83DRAFT_380266 [Aspergillus eucalypticola CBS 122712]|uniref:Uncharacterized protein n=1 Tax=Aspergillus eucalypticola (strain CBS 122712 / IBT 29274) TaxID=1448314 RepID=A0A317V213_ASPEC|nr:uncharacterized protein BO83DRAFT_380266 [Aspergillus eucalypticola CBS 122712]PWY68323.1 hypothetical protein BO83DRAFT_380266 [Aspergillus eucalypticola CBS 122712]
MKYIFTTLLLVSATLALPTDFSSQESTTAATQQEGIDVNPIGLLDDTLGLGRRGDLTSIELSAKRGNQVARQDDDGFDPTSDGSYKRASQDAQETTAGKGPSLISILGGDDGGLGSILGGRPSKPNTRRNNQDAQEATAEGRKPGHKGDVTF